MRSAVILLAIISSSASAQEAVSLKWSFKEGDRFFVKDESEMDMSFAFMGQNQEMKINATAVERFKIVSVKQDSTTVELTMIALDIKPANLPGLSGISDRIKGATVTAVLDDKMSVTKLQGYDKFIDKISDDDENTRKQMKQQFSEQNVKQMFTDVFSFAPNKPVKVGDTWPRTEAMSFGGLDASVKMKYKLESLTDSVAKMGYTGDMTFKVGDTLPGLPDGFKVDKLDMKTEKFAGTLKFDTKTGRVTEGTQDADMKGSMTIAFAGQKIDMTMTIKVKSKVTLAEKNPIKD